MRILRLASPMPLSVEQGGQERLPCRGLRPVAASPKAGGEHFDVPPLQRAPALIAALEMPDKSIRRSTAKNRGHVDVAQATESTRDFGCIGSVAFMMPEVAGKVEAEIASTAELREQIHPFDCRVALAGRSVEEVNTWLSAGVMKVILSETTDFDYLAALNQPDRVVVTLRCPPTAGDDEAALALKDRMLQLRPKCDEFLIQFTSLPGRECSVDLGLVRSMVGAADGARLTVSGGINTEEQLAALADLGVTTQVDAALWQDRLRDGNIMKALLKPSDRPDGLYTTVCTTRDGAALGPPFSSPASIKAALEHNAGVYFSRSRNELWHKGATSNARQRLISIDLNCERNALRFVVDQADPGFCHLGDDTCWGPLRGIAGLEKRIQHSLRSERPGYSKRLVDDPKLLNSKLAEEGKELADAKTAAEVLSEAADVIYFTAVKLSAHGLTMQDVGLELDYRALEVLRRPGNAKPPGHRLKVAAQKTFREIKKKLNRFMTSRRDGCDDWL
jgi:phosphoribosyl-ATP pyrophosphohydrolase